MYFDELNLNDNILDALDDMHFEECTPIQEKCIPEILEGHDVLGVAQTGTGKTAAFGLPLLQSVDIVPVYSQYQIKKDRKTGKWIDPEDAPQPQALTFGCPSRRSLWNTWQNFQQSTALLDRGSRLTTDQKVCAPFSWWVPSMHGEGGSWKTKARMGPAWAPTPGGACSRPPRAWCLIQHSPAGGAARNKSTEDPGRLSWQFFDGWQKGTLF